MRSHNLYLGIVLLILFSGVLFFFANTNQEQRESATLANKSISSCLNCNVKCWDGSWKKKENECSELVHSEQSSRLIVQPLQADLQLLENRQHVIVFSILNTFADSQAILVRSENDAFILSTTAIEIPPGEKRYVELYINSSAGTFQDDIVFTSEQDQVIVSVSLEVFGHLEPEASNPIKTYQKILLLVLVFVLLTIFWTFKKE